MSKSTSEQSEKTEIEPIGSPLGSLEVDRTAAFYGGSREAILLRSETREELARVPWWAGDDAIEEGDAVTIQGRTYTISAWGGRCVGRPAYVYVEPIRSSEGLASDLAALPDPESGEEAR
jgi:hypothetical protein